MKQIITTPDSLAQVDVQSSDEASTRLRGLWLIVARLVWIVLCGMAVTVYVALLPINLRNIVVDWELGLSFPAVSSFISMRQYGMYILQLRYVTLLVFLLTAAIIFWRKSDDWFGLFISLFLVIIPLPFGSGGYTGTWSTYSAPWLIIFNFFDLFLRAFAMLCFPLAMFLFPDGRFVPRWISVLCVLVLAATIFFLRQLYYSDNEIAFSLLWLTLVVSFIIALANQIYRYRYRSKPIQRQQTKWFVFGLAIWCFVATLNLLVMLILGYSPYKPLLSLVDIHLQLLGLTLIPVTIGFSILRYRLWDIDVIIRRTLIYGTITAAAFVIYLLAVGGTSLVLQSRNDLMAGVVALGIVAAAFLPIRRRLQGLIDKVVPYNPSAMPAKQEQWNTVTSECREEKETLQQESSAVVARGHTNPPNATSHDDMRLRGRWLLLARVAWAMAAIFTLVFYVVNQDILNRFWTMVNLTAEDQHILDQLGISTTFFTRSLVAIPLTYYAVAAVIVWRKSDDWMAVFGSLMLMTFGTVMFTSPLEPSAALLWSVILMRAVGVACFLIFFLLFPNGRFVPRWTRWLAIIWGVFTLSWLVFPTIDPYRRDWISGTIILLVCLGIDVFIQLYRYIRVSSPMQRQQTKWILSGFVVAFLGFSNTIAVPWISSFSSSLEWQSQSWYVSYLIFVVSVTFLPLSIGIAILRYRLWDIDILIRRSLIYGALTSCVVAIYVLVVGGLGVLLPSQSNLLIPIVALGLIAMLFQPLLHWLQARVERFTPLAPHPAVEQQVVISRLTSQPISQIHPSIAAEPLSIHWHGRPLILARIGWVAALGLALAYIVALAPLWNVTSLGSFNGFQSKLPVILALSLPYWLVAIFIAWRARDDGVALFVSATLLLFGAVYTGYLIWGSPDNSPLRISSWPGLVEAAIRAAGWGTLLIFFLIFPNGRFVPSWTRWLALGWIAYVGSWLIFPQLNPHVNTYKGLLSIYQIDLLFACSLVGVVAQLIRFYRETDRVRRQQTKWVIFGFTVAFLGISGLPLLLGTERPISILGIDMLLVVHVVSFTLIPLTVGFAVLRYRLWDIDIIIRRSLIYGTITATAFMIYLLAVGGMSIVLQERSDLAAGAIVIGLVAVAFVPARRHLQSLMDRVLPTILPPEALAEQEQWSAGIVRRRREEVEAVQQPTSTLNMINHVEQSEVEQDSDSQLRGSWLMLMRVVWGIIVALALVHIITRVGPIYNLARHQDAATISIQLFQLGISRDWYGISIVGLFLLVALNFIAVGIVIFWNKADNWIAFCISAMLMVVGARFAFADSELGIQYPWWRMLDAFITLLAQSSSLLFFYFFPNGRFTPRWTRYLVGGWVGWVAITYFSSNVSDWLEQQLGWPLLFLPWLIWYATGVVAQLYRYRYVSKPIERQQTKWILFGLTAPVLMFAFVLILELLGPWLPLLLSTNSIEWIDALLYQGYLVYLPLLLVPLSIGMAILRYRLWDIDIIIRRTLIYGALVGALVLVYLGSVAALQVLSQALTGPQSNLVIVATTLALAALFQPVRQRIQGFVDRRFYREKVDFRQAFTVFAREVRTIIELPALLRLLVERTTDLLHITHGAVFLRSDDGTFAVAESPNQLDTTSLLIDDELLERLHHGQTVARPKDSTFPLLVPLIAPVSQPEINDQTGEILIGVLALGPRLSEQGYTRDDEALLLGLADQAGTAVYVAQLVAAQQAEARRRAETERNVEAHRNSPIGRAETIAQVLLAAPGTALIELHQLATHAGHDPAAALVLEQLPRVLGLAGHPRANQLASMSDGFNYLFASQFQPELLAVGLRTLIGQLDLAVKDQSSTTDSGEPAIVDGAAEALAIYQRCQRMLEASSVAQITALMPGDWPPSTTPAPLAELSRMLGELTGVVDALRAYERVDTNQDKLAYLASAVERLSRVDRLARAELGTADRSLGQRIAESWLAVVTGAMGDLQTRAQISCTLLTRHTWVGDMIALVLAIRNDGRGAALGISVGLAPVPEYRLLDEAAQIEQLAAGEEIEIILRMRPQLASGADQFRARFVIRYADPRGPDQIDYFADEVRLLTAAEPFQFIPNPYVVGTPLQRGSPLFFGRDDLLTYITENLAAAHRNNLVLIGQRRTGKTSLLKQLPAQLGDDYLPIYLDGQSLGLDPGLPNFFLALATEIAFALDDRGFSVPPPELSDFAASPAATFERVFLEQVRSAIGDRHILLLLDEFEELEAAVRRGTLDASIFGFLRHIIQHSSNLSVIFCGTHRLEELAADYWSVLFNISLYRHVGFLERPEAERLIQDPVAAFGMRYDDLALEKIWRVTAGHPYFLQLLCHSLVNRHNKGERGYVTVADVNAALDEILASGEAHFVYLWTESNEHERLALAALSRLMPMTGHAAPAQIHDYLAERGVAIERQVIAPALHRLALRDILIATSAGDVSLGDVYHWKLGLLGLWVEKYRSLNRVIGEVHA